MALAATPTACTPQGFFLSSDFGSTALPSPSHLHWQRALGCLLLA